MSSDEAGKASDRSVRVRWNEEEPLTAGKTSEFGGMLFKLLTQHHGSDFISSTAHCDDEYCTTVTFSNVRATRKAYNEVSKHQKYKDHFDNVFSNLTLLVSPDKHDIDICAVHGLEGNAVDTFTADSKLWLRDLLPRTKPFDKARIMTFGYNSRLMEAQTTAGMTDWADTLLRAVGGVRMDSEYTDKPVLFVGHSMGGLVIRRAIERLHQFADMPEQYPGLLLKHCAILFLSTPHLGTTQADFSNSFSQMMSDLTGLRKDAILRELQSFNSSASSTMDVWRIMENKGVRPPFECLCESRKTKIGFLSREMVTPTAASFQGQSATQIPNADHHQVCKFNNTFTQGYKDVIGKLNILRSKIMQQDIASRPSTAQSRLPGSPFATAFRYPLNQNRKLYFGGALKESSGYFGGRQHILQQLQTAHTPDNVSNSNGLTAISGLGGIGKSEILLEYALAAREHSHVFHCQAVLGQSFHNCVYKLAAVVGSEVLDPDVILADREAVWASYAPDQRVKAFIKWLQISAIGPCIILVDDVDAFQTNTDLEDISEALRSWPHKVLLTTRDPELGDTIAKRSYRTRKVYVVDGMAPDELLNVMQSFITDDILIPETALRSIARLMQGHAMAACRAVQFICDEMVYGLEEDAIDRFLTSFNDSSEDYEYRKQFIEYKPQLQRSLTECFRTSIDRLGEDNRIALRILNLSAYLSIPEFDFRSFFRVPRPWLSDVSPELLPNRDIFEIPKELFRHALQRLVATSSVIRVNGAFVLHPLMIEYLLQNQQVGERVCILRQILLLVQISIQLNEKRQMFEQYVTHCKMIAKRFRIEYREITPPLSLWKGVEVSVVHSNDSGKASASIPMLKSKDAGTPSAHIAVSKRTDPGKTPASASTHQNATKIEDAHSPTQTVEPTQTSIQHLQSRLRGLTHIGRSRPQIFGDEEPRNKFFADARRLILEFERLQPQVSNPQDVTESLSVHASLKALYDDMLDLVNGINPLYYHKVYKLKKSLGQPCDFRTMPPVSGTFPVAR